MAEDTSSRVAANTATSVAVTAAEDYENGSGEQRQCKRTGHCQSELRSTITATTTTTSTTTTSAAVAATASSMTCPNETKISSGAAVAMVPPSNEKEKHGRGSKKTTKTVSFHSATSLPTERKIASANDCMQYMIAGSSLLKIRSSSRQYHRFFTLLENLSAIKWTPTSKKSNKALLNIDSIREIRSGKATDVFRNKELAGGYSADCSFSIIYGDHFDVLDLVAASPEEANIWVTGLNALIGANKSPDGSDDRQHPRDKWLQEMFHEADTEKNGCLVEQEAVTLVLRLNRQLTTNRIRQKIAEMEQHRTETNRGKICCKEFIEMYKEIATRPEIYFLLIRYANKDFLTAEDLQLFLEGEQGMSGLTADKCREIITNYEPSDEARRNGQLHIDGFSQYLLSEECDIFDPANREVCQDLSQPLTHYFVSTSHNTYLLEDQLKGPSSDEGYMWALSKGCRCIKIDCWDGAEEPVVYHGNTLTSRVSFCEVLSVVKAYAFKASRYPLIIHLENHCNVENQKFIAFHLKSELKDLLYIHPPNSGRSLCEMSPSEIGSKIILKGRKLIPDCQSAQGDVSDEDEGGDGQAKIKAIKKKVPLCRELSDLISLTRVKFSFFHSSRNQSDAETFSLCESTAAKLAHACPEDFVQHNKHFLTRVFPNSSRIDSSNYNPQDFWNCGCQMVALNYQTPGQMLDLYDGRFRQNGGCGYVLKPTVMREQVSFFSAHTKGVIPGLAPQTLRLKIISGQQLPRPRGSTAKGEAIDPYVVVQIFGIPADCAEVQTKTVSNEGNCPIFDESFEFQINLPELALVRFVVLDDEYIGDDFIGQYTIPFDCIQTGYRHIRLLAPTGTPLTTNCTLFVHIAITNKRGGGKPQKKFRKANMDVKPIGVKAIDDILKNVVPSITDAGAMRAATEAAMYDLQEEFGLVETANVKQCLRVLLTRVATGTESITVNILKASEFPELQVTGPISPHLSKTIGLFEKLLQEFRSVIDNSCHLLETLTKAYEALLELYEELEPLSTQSGLKGRKLNKALETYAWNMQMLRGQIDLLASCRKECQLSIAQMLTSTDTQLSSNYKNKDRSPVVPRDKPRLALQDKGLVQDWGTIPRSPTSPCDGQPKGILKNKSSSLSLEPRTPPFYHLEPS